MLNGSTWVWALTSLAALALAGCGESSTSEPAGGSGGGGGSGPCPSNQEKVNGSCVDACNSGLERHEGACVSPVQRYEPAERVDFDNVLDYSGGDLRGLQLPEPPKSGFRIIGPPLDLEPGDEDITCFAWPYPELKNKHVYAARLYTTRGLHHSNVYGMTLSESGPSNYPTCAPGQADPYSKFSELAGGIVPDVLFANSTQIIGEESIVFPPGMAYELHMDQREIATNIHYLNTTSETIRFEVAYDFYTVDIDQVETPLAPYYFDNFAFEVPARTRQDVATQCNVFGGNLVTMMSHTHERTENFKVELFNHDGEYETVYEVEGYDVNESEIQIFDKPISLDSVSAIRHTCTINNDLDKTIDYGIGDDEMCTLFGYMYPAELVSLGIVQPGASGCLAVQVGSD